MIKYLFLATVSLFSMEMTVANSVHIKIINNSNTPLHGDHYRVNNGKLCGQNPLSLGPDILPGESGQFYTGEACSMAGTDGFIEYVAQRDGKTYQVYIGFDVPFIGDNEYDPRASSPFFISHISGGDGSDVFITYEVTGGPSPLPPPAPLLLPTKGNRIISGYFSWDADVTGMPYVNDLRTAFVVRVKAPKFLKLNHAGTGPHAYGDTRGSFEELQPVGLVVFSLQQAEGNTLTDRKFQQTTIANSKRLVYYRILNLPEGVPIDISVEPAVSWLPGSATEPKPDKPYAEYITYCKEKSKTVSSIIYSVAGAWFYNNGAGGNGGSTTDNGAALKDMLNKNGKSTGYDIVFGNGGINANNSLGNGRTGTVLNNKNFNQGTSVPATNGQHLFNSIQGSQIKATGPVQQKTVVQPKIVVKKNSN